MEARRAWHVAAMVAFAVAALTHTRAWFTEDRMPPADFAGYAAQVQYVRDALLEHGRVPRWCVECYGGTTNFTANFKEYLVFPLAVATDPVTATKIAFVLLRWLAAYGMFVLVSRQLAAPAVGIAAGYAYSWCAMANFQIQLDIAVAAAILPLLWLSAAELLRVGGARWAVALGLAMACQLANNWVHAATAPLAVVALALLRPWRGAHDVPPWRDRALARRWAARGIAAFAVFCAFAASSVTWLASDARHHALMPSRTIELQRLFYVERSPFLFANRDGALRSWIENHAPAPPYRAMVVADEGGRYVGAVLVAVIALGVWIARRDPPMRRWAVLAGLAWLLQYWLALGPRTLWWQVAESLHYSADTQVRVVWAMRAAAALCAVAGVALAAWPRIAARRARIRASAPLFVIFAVLLVFPTASLWSACARVLPMFALQRSPGHFFDTAPFFLTFLFAVCLTAIARRIARPLVAHALAIGVAAALALDFWPSTKTFADGAPLAPLRRSTELVADVPGDGGMLRIGLGPGYSPVSSWLLGHSSAGHAWGWIFWQAGRYWRDGYAFGAFGDIEGTAQPWSDRYAPLLGAARVRYVLVQSGATPPSAPWRLVRSDEQFALWEGPDVAPAAQGYRAWVLWTGDDPNWAAQAAADALRANALVVAPPSDAAAAEALRASASSVLAGEPPTPLLAAPAPPPVPAKLRRAAPERITLALDAGAAPALAFVSEGYHPWWRAEVDGRPAPVLRASIAHMAVPVGPGRHAVELRLVRPFWVAAADAITAAAWIALALGLAWCVLRRWRDAPSASRPT